MPRTAAEIRDEIARVEAEWRALDPMACQFTHGAGRGGKATRSQRRSSERRVDRTFRVADRLNALQSELAAAERREAGPSRDKLEARLAEFLDIQRTGFKPSGAKLTNDERAAVKSIIRDLRIQLKPAA